ncbi:3338_t:CDS:2 [Acaulospora colombiana]|uniref:3338_t:CDS:1 n=1 Tax=Acaulospora colombiana TaxID=27376 RepID=A0ACA9MEW0_9GLOM|nr:3338_t:CDS:2 [Acaulospora colombiana]
MTDTKKFAPLSLKEANWDTWSFCMEMLLQKQNLWDVVDGTEAMPAGSQNSKPVKVFTRKRKEAIITIWKKLKDVMGAHGLGARMALRRKFRMLKMSIGTETMREWISRVEELVRKMRNQKINVDDMDVVVALTDSLPASYAALSVWLDGVPEDELTIDLVIRHLLNEEMRQSHMNEVELDHKLAFAAYNKKKAKPIKEITCWNCKQKGHYQLSCTEKSTNTNEGKKKTAVLGPPRAGHYGKATAV